MIVKPLRLTYLLLCLLISGVSFAKEVVDEEADPKLWSGSIDVGFTNTDGNTNERNLKAKALIEYNRDKWRNTFNFDTLNTESEGTRSAERYFVADRQAYQYDEANYVYGYGSYDDDRFSGYQYQGTLSAGWGRRLIHEESMEWDAEVGPGYRRSKTDRDAGSDTQEEAIIRGFTQYSWDFSETANFMQLLSVEAGDKNTISRSETALKVSIYGSLSMKLAYTIKYTEKVPAGKVHAGTETSFTLSYDI